MPQSGNPEQRVGSRGLHAELGYQTSTLECPVCFASPLETVSSGLQAVIDLPQHTVNRASQFLL